MLLGIKRGKSIPQFASWAWMMMIVCRYLVHGWKHPGGEWGQLRAAGSIQIYIMFFKGFRTTAQASLNTWQVVYPLKKLHHLLLLAAWIVHHITGNTTHNFLWLAWLFLHFKRSLRPSKVTHHLWLLRGQGIMFVKEMQVQLKTQRSALDLQYLGSTILACITTFPKYFSSNDYKVESAVKGL